MQVTETEYNAIARTLSLFALNPSYVRSLSPDDCKQMLEAIAHQYFDKERQNERIIELNLEEHFVWSRIFYSEGSNLIFFNIEEQERYAKVLDDVISSFSEEDENAENQITLLNIVKAIREKIPTTEAQTVDPQ